MPNEKQQIDIARLEAAISKANPNDPETITLYAAIGESYLSGLRNAPVDVQKAVLYFRMAADKGDAYSNYMLGGFYLWDDRSADLAEGMNFGIGLMYLCKSHLGGYQAATNMIDKMIESGMLNDNISCIDDLINENYDLLRGDH